MGVFRRKVFHPFRGRKMISLLSRFAPPGRILDYGFGEGRLLRAMKAAGMDVVGADYSARLVDARRIEGLDVRQANDIKHTGIQNRTLACVLASHVIEHLTDPLTFLRDARNLITPSGVLVAAVPSRTSLRARFRTSDWHFVDPPNHNWSFSPRNFRLLLEKSGWTCLYIENELIVNELISVSRLGEA